jgi:hypothetical protein
MTKFLLIGLLALGAGLSGAAPAARAQESSAGGGLVVSPTYILFDGTRERTQSLTLSHRGSKPETYRISLINRRMTPDGQLVDTEVPAAGEGFANALVRYAPRQVVLQPGQPQTVRLMLQMPADTRDGEYRSHILLRQVPSPEPATPGSTASADGGLAFSIRAVFGVTVPLIVRKGELSADATLGDLRLLQLPDNRPAVALKVNRSGTRSLRGDIKLAVDGAPVGELNGVSVFLSTPYRDVIVPLAEPINLKGRRLSVEFHEARELAGAVIANQSFAP